MTWQRALTARQELNLQKYFRLVLAFKGLKLYVSAVGNRSHDNLEGIVPTQVLNLTIGTFVKTCC